VREPSIRRARVEEAALLTELAHAAKRHWGYPERWVAEWSEALTLRPAWIATHPVYVAVQDGEVVGFYALAPEGDTCRLEHLWVRPAWIGRGVGRLLFEHAVRTATAAAATQLVLDSDPHAEGFYRRMGATRVGVVPADVQGKARGLPRMRLALPWERTRGTA